MHDCHDKVVHNPLCRTGAGIDDAQNKGLLTLVKYELQPIIVMIRFHSTAYAGRVLVEPTMRMTRF